MSCALCGKAMSLRQSRNSPVSYFHCAGCGRWVASNYREDVLRSNTARLSDEAIDGDGRNAEQAEFERIKSRFSAFLAAIDERDPYQVLGVSPADSNAAIRERFHALALTHHPDRGGDVAQMQRYAQAYERICQGRLSRMPLLESTPPAIHRAPRFSPATKNGRR